MTKKFIFTILGITLLMSSTVFADVFITKQGGKYHLENCPLIANKETQKITEQDAMAKGLTPCSRCIGKEQVNKNNEDLVFITANGKKYHRQDCNLIAKRKTEGISLVDAKAKGLEPCGRCFKTKDK